MGQFTRIGIIAKVDDPRVGTTLEALCAQLDALSREWIADASAAPYLERRPPAVPRAEIGKRCDLVIVVGGDGTLLEAARSLAATGVPLLGVNQGRLGFMVDLRPDAMKEALAQILQGDYVREERLILCASVVRRDGRRGPFLAINDVVVRNQAAVRMLDFETWLDGEFISQHRADGFIVSSPTGSTAYALSSGGPVLHPNLDAIALVPICPHTLSDRPLVVNGDRPIRIVLGGDEGVRAMCTCDGQVNEDVFPGDTVEVARAPHALQLIHPANYNYFHILRDKLRWGRSPQPRAETKGD